MPPQTCNIERRYNQGNLAPWPDLHANAFDDPLYCILQNSFPDLSISGFQEAPEATKARKLPWGSETYLTKPVPGISPLLGQLKDGHSLVPFILRLFSQSNHVFPHPPLNLIWYLWT